MNTTNIESAIAALKHLLREQRDYEKKRAKAGAFGSPKQMQRASEDASAAALSVKMAKRDAWAATIAADLQCDLGAMTVSPNGWHERSIPAVVKKDLITETVTYRDGTTATGVAPLPALSPAQHCQCDACIDGVIHYSSCAVHNEPAYPNGECDCGALTPQDVLGGGS